MRSRSALATSRATALIFLAFHAQGCGSVTPHAAGPAPTYNVTLAVSSASTPSAQFLGTMFNTSSLAGGASGQNFLSSNGSGSVKLTPSSGASGFANGNYLLIVQIDDNLNGAVQAGEHGAAIPVTINGGDVTVTADGTNLKTMVRESITATHSGIPDGSKLHCYWLVPGADLTRIPQSEAIANSQSSANTFVGGTMTTDLNDVMVPSTYDLLCWVDTNGDNVLNAGDYLGTKTSVAISGSGTAVSLVKQ